MARDKMASLSLNHLKFLIKVKFGSHVYGTSLATSDIDIKGIYIPSVQDIMLQRVTSTLNFTTKDDPTKRNTQSDLDIEIFSLQKYLDLLIEGQTIALDILFTPPDFHLCQPHPIWIEIQKNKHRFLHSGTTAFAKYCRLQAAKYGMKGTRMAAIRQTLELFSTFSPLKKLSEYRDEIDELIRNYQQSVQDSSLIALIECFDKNRQVNEHFLQVCNRKLSLNISAKQAIQILKRIYGEYGQRAKLAEKNEGIDWKALMHAARVLFQGKELLNSGHITFPRPERDLLLKIRQGDIKYQYVAQMIENGLKELNEAALASPLSKEADRDYADNLVFNFHINLVKEFISDQQKNPIAKGLDRNEL